MIQLMFCFSTLLSRLAFHTFIYRIFRPFCIEMGKTGQQITHTRG
mgnify:FL=1